MKENGRASLPKRERSSRAGAPDPMPQRDVLIVGSVPLADAEAVFRAVAGALGERVRRIPDGETGARINWI